MIPSECGCSRIAVEAAKPDLGWLLNAAFQVKFHQGRLSTATLASRVNASRADTDTSAAAGESAGPAGRADI